MSENSFGKFFKFSTWGESHGKAIGCVIDGVPPMVDLSEDDIQPALNKRKPGQNKFTTQRKEPDEVEIFSGVFDGKTTGTPISLIIHNQDQRSKDYGEIKDQFRPGHADYAYMKKYGIRDYRGGGRSSARETAMRVAAGAVAKKIAQNIHPELEVTGYLTQIGTEHINRDNVDFAEINNNPFFCPDAKAAKAWEEYVDNIRKDGSSIGAVIEVTAKGMPIGLGEPVYGKLDNELASAMMSINAVKGVEIGAGFKAAELSGEENADQMRGTFDNPEFLSNNNGGTIGGISSGQDLVVRFAVKPTSSILNEVKSIDKNGNEIDLRTKGRHDPCVGIRAVPVGEAMMWCVLLDHILRHRAQCGS